MAIKAYVSDTGSIVAKAISDSPATAKANPASTVPLSNSWSDVENKPFESVDGKTLEVSGGVLKFKTGSYKALSDLPSIEGVALADNKTFEDLGLAECSILDIEKMFV